MQRAMDRDKTVTKLRLLSPLGLALSEKQIPQVVENFESGDKWKKALERANMRQGRCATRLRYAPTIQQLA